MPDTHAPWERFTRTAAILRYLLFAGGTLLLFLMFIEPDVGFSAPPAARLLFWTAQIAAGLLILQTTLYALTRLLGASRIPTWGLVVLSGILGAVLLAPVYWLIGEGMMERWLGYPALPDEESLTLGSGSVGRVLVEEYVDIVGPVTAAWALVCLPRLHWLVPPMLQRRLAPGMGMPAAAIESAPPTVGEFQPPRDLDTPRAAADRGDGRHETSQPEAACSEPAVEPIMPVSSPPAAADWISRLPKELGNDVIAVASELQYLRVWTSRGCALVLGALADVEAAGADDGLRVHRSWWVACRHVSSVRRTATGAVCQMSDGRQVPVSRRRRAEVLARFGDGAQYLAPSASETVANANLD